MTKKTHRSEFQSCGRKTIKGAHPHTYIHTHQQIGSIMSLFSVYTMNAEGNHEWMVQRASEGVVVAWLMSAEKIDEYRIVSEDTGMNFQAKVWVMNRTLDSRSMSRKLSDSLNYLAQFMPKFYKMNPSTDDLLPSGDHLANGMKVLIENPNNRVPIGAEGLSDWKEDRALENNRWCTVESLRIVRETLRFIGVYEDGTKKMRSFPVEEAWYAKRNSIQEITAKYQKVFDTVRLAVAYHETLIKQDGDLVEDVTGNIEETTRRLMELL